MRTLMPRRAPICLRSSRFTLATLVSPSSSTKSMPARKILKFFFYQRLITNEGLEEIIRERHVASRFPIADSVGFLEFAIEGDFGLDIQPESQDRAAAPFRKSRADNRAQCRERARARSACKCSGRRVQPGPSECRKNAPLKLIEEIGAVHQRQGHAGDGVFGQQRVDVVGHQQRTTQSRRLHRETFRFEPFGKQRNLRRAARAVRAFDDDQRCRLVLLASRPETAPRKIAKNAFGAPLPFRSFATPCRGARSPA